MEMRYFGYDPTTLVQLTGDDYPELVWSEPAPPRWRRDRHARQMTGEPGVLDAAYAEARKLATCFTRSHAVCCGLLAVRRRELGASWTKTKAFGATVCGLRQAIWTRYGRC